MQLIAAHDRVVSWSMRAGALLVVAIASGGCDLVFKVEIDGPLECPAQQPPMMVKAGTFCIDATEVTRGQYDAFVADKVDTASQIAECAANTTFLPTENYPAPAGTENLPVDHVDWCDAAAYCTWAGKRLCGRIDGGPSADLFKADASKDQWFAACTGGGARAYPYGNAYDAGACQIGGTILGYTNPTEVGDRTTCEGGYPGLFDMIGNVGEWVDICPAADACYARGGEWYMTGTDQLIDCAGAITHGRVNQPDSTFWYGIRCCSP
jgi:formylglycine-generating enzyme